MKCRGLCALALTSLVGVGAWANPAVSAEPTARGGAGTLRIAGDPDSYALITPSSPLTLSFKGAGLLTIKLRSVLPAGGAASEGAQVQLRLPGGGVDKATLSVFPAPGKSFSGRTDRVPGGAGKDRVLQIEEGSGTLVAAVQRGEAAIAIRWKGKVARHREVAAAPRRHAPPAATEPLVAPLASGGDAVAGNQAAPLAPAEAPTAEPPLRATTEATSTPLPTAESSSAAQSAVASRFETDRKPEPRVLPLALIGGAALCAVGSAVATGLAVGQNDSYNGTPELRGGVATNRAGQLSTANGEVAAAEILGAAALALLVASGLTLVF